MISESSTEFTPTKVNPFAAADVAAVLRERGWLDREMTAETQEWMNEAAVLLGPHAADRNALADLLSLVFEYDARAILRSPESPVVLAREGAREVIRELAHLVLEGPALDSDRFKEIVTALKVRLRFRGRELFHPLRLALAGRAGGGELDRVILLLDPAARLIFRVPVKGSRQRMLEFCASTE